MKHFKILAVVLAVVLFSVSGCNILKKAGISTDDVVSAAKGLVDMSFGSGADGPFEVTKTKVADATLVIQNDTDRTITVKVTGPTAKTFVVTKGKTDYAVVKPGSFHFEATAPNTGGAKGDAELKGYNQYTWIFVIR